jgi:hypothetical protein
LYLPSEFIDNGFNSGLLNSTLFKSLNSPEYYTVYPPVNQFLFALCSFPQNPNLFSILLKIGLVLAEFGTIMIMLRILAHLKLPKQNVILYALNPLIIIETVGNLHLESLMIFFLMLTVYRLTDAKALKSSIYFTLSIGSKLLTLMFSPIIFLWNKMKSRWVFFVSSVIMSSFLFLPILLNIESGNYTTSLDLYFRKFEFNASIYYLIRWIGFQTTGYNIIAIIGPILKILSLIIIIGLSIKYSKGNFQELFTGMLFIFITYLFLSTTVHPWYLAVPVALCIFTNYRFPIIWSYRIFWTYMNYNNELYDENLLVVFLEYTVVLALFYFEKFNSLKLKFLNA